MIAVTAASGQFGHIVIETLKKKVDPSQIVVIARNASKAGDLNVEVRQADYADPVALQAALTGIEKVLLVSGLSPERVKEHTNVVDAAKANGVKSIVYTSILNAERWTIPTFRQHLETEEMIRKSGLAFTFLRNGWYT
jgi:NAD(P)H dehydrogenase (quinone)